MAEMENPRPTIRSCDIGAPTLSDLFEKCMDLWDKLENSELASVSDEYQEIVKKGIIMLENVTNLVNETTMFSSNENIDEVASSHLKFMLLPALLGYFNMKLHFQTITHRTDQLLLSEEYYKDFLKRLKSYELQEVDIPDIKDYEDLQRTQCEQENTPPVSMRAMAMEREAAISSYKKTRDVERRLNAVKSKIAFLDEAGMREYHLLTLKLWTYRAIKELHTIETEKCVLQSMLQPPPKTKSTQPKPPPFYSSKPFIIVRNELQKKVYGAGYPSLPMMTVDEFYAQRYPVNQQHETPAASMNSLQQRAADPEAAAKHWEREDVEKEEKFEKDDPETLQKARAFDDWKDENRTGCGNRKNKG